MGTLRDATRRRLTAAAHLAQVAARRTYTTALWGVSTVADQQHARAHTLLTRTPGAPLPLTELRISSQNGEDGVLWELFTHIRRNPYLGTFVEIGAHPQQSTALFLAQRAGWSGLFLDANRDRVEGMKRVFHNRTDITCQRATVTPNNITVFLTNQPRDLDLLCIDIDGADSYLVEALPRAPKVLVVEINSTPGRENYRQSHQRQWDRSSTFGTGITRMDEICAAHNLSRVYVESTGANAFYVRDDYLQRLRYTKVPYAVTANYFGLGLHHPHRLTGDHREPSHKPLFHL